MSTCHITWLRCASTKSKQCSTPVLYTSIFARQSRAGIKRVHADILECLCGGQAIPSVRAQVQHLQCDIQLPHESVHWHKYISIYIYCSKLVTTPLLGLLFECIIYMNDYIYPAARADEDEVDASSGASSRAPSTSKQTLMRSATPTTCTQLLHIECCAANMNSCMVLLAGLNKEGYQFRTHCMAGHSNTRCRSALSRRPSAELWF